MQRARWVAVGVAALLAFAPLASVVGASTKPPKAPKPSKPVKLVPTHKLLLQGPVTFWECGPKTTKVLIGVNALTLHPGDTLHINFIVRNEGSKSCNYVAPYAGVAPGPTTSALQAGPCGSIGFEIVGAHGRNVWPGVQTFNCPALGFAQLQPNGTAVGSGTWDQSMPSGSRRVAPGHYTLVVGGHFAFALRLAAH
jgi:hypothetical protein